LRIPFGTTGSVESLDALYDSPPGRTKGLCAGDRACRPGMNGRPK
jgi:hypothetical protein